MHALFAAKAYIEEHIRFPPDDSTTQRGVVILRFTVSQTGNIEDVSALRSPGDSFTQEAKRLLLEGPGWLPASSNQQNREDAVRLRIIFKK